MPEPIPFSEPDVAVEQAGAAEPPPPESNMLGSVLGGYDPARIAIVGLFVMALMYTLYFARSLLLPIVLALMLDFLLSPVIRGLRRLRIPAPLGAGLVMLTMLAVLVGLGLRLAPAASGWLQRAPQTFQEVEVKLRDLRRPVEQVTQAARQVEEATDMDEAGETQKVQIEGPSLSDQIFGGTTALLGGLTFVVFLTYFLLAAGDLFLQKLISVLPQFSDKKRAVSIARTIEAQVSTHLFTVSLINLGLGVVTALITWLYGLPNPLLWGLTAALFNFVPYVGAIATTIVIGLASIATFDSIGYALLPPLTFFVVNAFEGNLVTPMILGRQLTLNTVAVFIGLMFFWFVWGIPGAILAVPMLVTIKIFCDHFESLAPVGEFLGR